MKGEKEKRKGENGKLGRKSERKGNVGKGRKWKGKYRETMGKEEGKNIQKA